MTQEENPKTIFGLAKIPLHVIPPRALLQVGQAMAVGKAKYGHFNWRNAPVPATIYYDAALRHNMSWFDREEFDPSTGVHHLAFAAANNLLLLDALAGGWLIDDRHPVPGTAGDYIAETTQNPKDVR